MANAAMIRTILGVFGNIVSFCLFMSPLPTFVKIWKAKSTLDFKPDPYVVTILNCATWTFYGLPFVTKHNVLVVTINGFGVFLEVLYCIIFVVFSRGNKRRKLLLALLVEAIFLVLLVFLILHFVHTLKQRKLIVGFICVVFNVLMYISPLTVMRRVIKTKSVKYMPLLLSLAGTANGIIWLVYGLLKWDPFIVFPNGAGAVSGFVQLILYAVYYRTTDWDEESVPRVSV